MSQQEKAGWELDDLINLLKNDKPKLQEYVNSYPLSAISPTGDRFAVIREFAARELDGRIDMLNAPAGHWQEHYPIFHYGMTLTHLSKSGLSSHNIILPNTLNYKRLSLEGEEISNTHSEGLTITNIQEIDCLWTLEEQEILFRFKSLKNVVQEVEEVEKSTEILLEDDFFGQLKFNEQLDWYEVEKEGVEFSFMNTTTEQLIDNFRKAQRLLPLFTKIERQMIEEMLALKNDSWLDDGEQELSHDDFQKEITLYNISIYEDGSAYFYYRANDLFWGHDIQTDIDEKHNYGSSTIVG